MNFLFIFLKFLLLSVVRAVNPFEGGLFRDKCMKGRQLTGCNETLLEAYKRTNLWTPGQITTKADTYIMLLTRRNKDNPEYLDECGGSLPGNTYFNPKMKLEILIHGFLETVCRDAWMRETKDQLLFREDCNVMLVDYGWGNQLDYYDGLRNGEVVGKQVAFVIQNIVKKTGFETNKIHIVGVSLGAHIAGVVGDVIKQLLGKSVRRISGLDPAGPGLRETSLQLRLDKGDADLVDIIHANGGKCLPFALGYPDPLGHVDFYPNGGSVQLSCISYIFPSIIKGDILYAAASLLLPVCFHAQSIQYYKVSINACICQFIGIKCNSYEDFKAGKCKSCGKDGSNCAVMGMDFEDYPWTEENTNNTYYLDTSMSCPYCDNKGINLEGFPLLPPGKEEPKCFPTIGG